MDYAAIMYTEMYLMKIFMAFVGEFSLFDRYKNYGHVWVHI